MIVYPPSAPVTVASPEPQLQLQSQQTTSPRQHRRSAKHYLSRKRITAKLSLVSEQQRMPSSLPDYPLQVLAQKLNNKGASHLQTGNHHRAIPYFAKALRLTEELSQQDEAAAQALKQPQPCTCSHCQLETCLLLSSKTRSSNSNNNNNNDVPPPPPSRFREDSPLSPTLRKRRVPQEGSPSSSSSSVNSTPSCPMPFPLSSISDHEPSGIDGEEDEDGSTWQGGYVYREPLMVSLTCIQEEHDMGVTLSLVVLFNLALAYQLVDCLEKAQKLYELCYQLQVEQDPQSSLWFTMCLANNLSEIHRRQGNHERMNLCLQHLLSTTMYMVDCHQQSNHHRGADNRAGGATTTGERHHTLDVDMAPAPASTTTTTTTTMAWTTTTQSYEQQQQQPQRIHHQISAPSSPSRHHIECHDYMMKTVLDGFFRNVSLIILGQNVAARAA